MKKVRAGVITTFDYSIDDYMNNRKFSDDGKRLRKMVDEDRQKIIDILNRFFDVVDGGAMRDIPDVEPTAKRFQCESVDMLIVVSQLWPGDKPLLRLLQKLGDIPVLYWCYTPTKTLPEHMMLPDLYRRSGAVGAMQNAAMLTRMGKSRCVVTGALDDEVLIKELEDYAAAYSVLKALKSLRVGHVCGRFEQMTGTYVDEFKCITKLGAEYVPITLKMMKEAAEAITDEEIKKEADILKAHCSEILVSDDDLYKALRASITMRVLADRYDLGCMTVMDFDEELLEYFGTRPQLWVSGLTEKGITISVEGDLLTAVAMWISRQLGETTPMYVEMFTYDLVRNGVLCGHAAMMDTALAGNNPIRLIPDAEMAPLSECNGAWTGFTGKSGHVVMNGMYTEGDTYAFAMFEGNAESLPLLDIHPNVFVKLNRPVKEFFGDLMYLGINQHFGLSYDDVAERWRKFAKVSGFKLVEF